MASESNIRPVTDGEANESDAELRGRLTQLALNALHATSHSKPNWREEQKALFDAIAALARQAPAPLSQAVPEGEHSRLHEWAMAAGLADVECEEAEIRPFLQRFAALVLSSQPQAVPEGWKLERDTGGGAIIINGPNDVGGCVAYREPIAGRMIPEAILFALADSLLSRQPQPQAVTEDARDGERKS